MSFDWIRRPVMALVATGVLCSLAIAGLQLVDCDGNVYNGAGSKIGEFVVSAGGDVLNVHFDDSGNEREFYWNSITGRYEDGGGYMVITDFHYGPPSYWDYMYYGTGVPGQLRVVNP